MIVLSDFSLFTQPGLFYPCVFPFLLNLRSPSLHPPSYNGVLVPEHLNSGMGHCGAHPGDEWKKKIVHCVLNPWVRRTRYPLPSVVNHCPIRDHHQVS